MRGRENALVQKPASTKVEDKLKSWTVKSIQILVDSQAKSLCPSGSKFEPLPESVPDNFEICGPIWSSDEQVPVPP